MQLKKYIPDFLLPTDEPAVPGPIYDVPLRRELFHKTRPGNEYTLSASSSGSRNNSVVSERRKSSVSPSASSPESKERRMPWHPFMAFGH
ncbi:hypothetical protein A1O3_08078 [Capronia epimyces CBS 606.96]|uniref:Uncharacterized protein n=1 Tax=Capronia epimyces CBS 606.96 TaxID=1182542 RepID=W9XHT5_9EURO|nr:uncharacterized protein A1O3_08078 [Capronia epimyces CBS 606.96]EXJ79793.1 hypothetical protein A1O3_08078 [Capronia epimyces CBS 606.96]